MTNNFLVLIGQCKVVVSFIATFKILPQNWNHNL